jgi:hypothetical protein
MKLFAYVGSAIEIRCYLNETTQFTQINHILLNGSVVTLLSNEHINQEQLNNTEIRLLKSNSYYKIKIYPVKFESAGVYTCEDDTTRTDQTGHYSNVTLSVVGKLCFINL